MSFSSSVSNRLSGQHSIFSQNRHAGRFEARLLKRLNADLLAMISWIVLPVRRYREAGHEGRISTADLDDAFGSEATDHIIKKFGISRLEGAVVVAKFAQAF